MGGFLGGRLVGTFGSRSPWKATNGEKKMLEPIFEMVRKTTWRTELAVAFMFVAMNTAVPARPSAAIISPVTPCHTR